MINLKHKRTQQWLTFWVVNFLCLYYIPVILIPFLSTPDLDLPDKYAALIVLIYLLYFPYLVFCFFRTIAMWTLYPQDIEYGYSKKFDPKLRAPEIIKCLEDSNLSSKKISKLEHELSIIIKEYKSLVGSRKKLEEEREKQLEKEVRQNRAFLRSIPEQQSKLTHGPIATKIKCPHCHEVGKVRRKIEKNIEESSEKGIVGALIGKKMVTDKGSITRFYCENCETPWTA